MFNQKIAAIQQNQAILSLISSHIALNNDDESLALQFSYTFPGWANANGVPYYPGDYLRYGEDAEGLPIIYKVLRYHVTATAFPPDQMAIAYQKVGYVDGVRLWSRPSSTIEAPNTGSIRHYEGVNYRSTKDANIFPPNAENPAQYGWEVYVSPTV